MHKTIFSLLFLCMLTMTGPAWGLSTSSSLLINYLEEHFPAQYKILSTITQQYQNKVVFPCPKKTIARGQELLVLNKKKKVPVYLLPQSAVIKILSTFNNKAVARVICQLGDPVKLNDPVVIPAAPIIYLYTNIKHKNSLPAYQKLLQDIIKNNYQVVEIYKDKPSIQDPEYGLLLRIEYENQELTTKICSLFTGNTFFVHSIPYKKYVATFCPPGRPIYFDKLQKAQADHGQQGQSIHQTHTPPPLSYRLSSSMQKKNFFQPPPAMQNRSIRLGEKFLRLVACSITGADKHELCLLNDTEIVVYACSPSRLVELARYKFRDQSTIPFHLHTMDIDQDGQDELLVTLLRPAPDQYADNTELCSQVLSFKNGRLTALGKDLSYYLRVIEDRSGHKILLGQRKGTTDPYTGEIYKLTWHEKDKNFQTVPYPPAKDVYSIYQFNLIPTDPKHIFIIEPSNFLSVYFTPTEKLQAITDNNFGFFKITPCKIKLTEEHYLGGFNKKTFKYFYAPRRFILKGKFANQVFLINKQRETNFELGKIKKIVFNKNAEDSVTALKWTGQDIAQTWQSSPVAKDVLDFTFFSQNKKEQLCLLLEDRLGCVIQFTP